MHDHNKAIMVCIHVIENFEPIGEMDDELKEDTLVCQKCIDVIAVDEINVDALPKEVFLACKECVLKKLHSTKINKVKFIGKGDLR